MYNQSIENAMIRHFGGQIKTHTKLPVKYPRVFAVVDIHARKALRDKYHSHFGSEKVNELQRKSRRVQKRTLAHKKLVMDNKGQIHKPKST